MDEMASRGAAGAPVRSHLTEAGVGRRRPRPRHRPSAPPPYLGAGPRRRLRRPHRRTAAGSSWRGRPFSTTGRPLWTGRPRSRPTACAPPGPGGRSRIEVAIDRTRSVAKGAGISVTRRSDFESQAQMNLCPPRVRVEDALLTVASRSPDEEGAVAVLADACQTPAHHSGPARGRSAPETATGSPAVAALDPGGCGEWCLLRPGAPLSAEGRTSARASDRQSAAAGPGRSSCPLPGRRVSSASATTVELDGRHRSRGDLRSVGRSGSRYRGRGPGRSDAQDRLEAGARPVSPGGCGRPDPDRPWLDRAAPAVPTRMCARPRLCRSSSVSCVRIYTALGRLTGQSAPSRRSAGCRPPTRPRGTTCSRSRSRRGS